MKAAWIMWFKVHLMVVRYELKHGNEANIVILCKYFNLNGLMYKIFHHESNGFSFLLNYNACASRWNGHLKNAFYTSLLIIIIFRWLLFQWKMKGERRKEKRKKKHWKPFAMRDEEYSWKCLLFIVNKYERMHFQDELLQCQQQRQQQNWCTLQVDKFDCFAWLDYRYASRGSDK